MRSKWLLYLIFCLLFETLPAQNKQILYDFDQIPQTLMLNPGAIVDYNKHFGMPLFSNIYFQGGVSNEEINYNNVYADSRKEVLDSINKYYKNDDFFLFNQQWEVFNIGYKLKHKNIYLSFGMNQKLEGFAKDPETILNLIYPDEDIQDPDEIKAILEEQKLIGNLLGIFHVGVSFKVSDKLNLGARLKFLSASADYYKPFKILGENADSKGVLRSFLPSIIQSFKEIYPGLFFADGNVGMGVDLGFTYLYSKEIEFSGSLLDLDYVNYKNYNTIYDDFVNTKPLNLISPFNVTRPIKLNASAKYKFFHQVYVNKWKSIYKDARYVSAVEKILTTEIGLQTYTAFRPDNINWAVTAFASHDFNQYITTKITYTYDAFSYKNIGLGISTHYKFFNLFATADNLLNLFKIEESNYQSIQFGMNFVF